MALILNISANDLHKRRDFFFFGRGDTMNRLSRQCMILGISQPYVTACYADSFTFFFCVVFIVRNVSFIVCVALCAVFGFRVV
jgi:hypothetical protein